MIGLLRSKKVAINRYTAAEEGNSLDETRAAEDNESTVQNAFSSDDHELEKLMSLNLFLLKELQESKQITKNRIHPW